MRILVTGSRNWTDGKAIEAAILDITREAFNRREPITIVHGGHTHGADQIAAGLTVFHGWVNEPHPAAWELHGKAAGPIRNQEMVDSGADACLAFPKDESRGTRDCMRRAEAAGIPVQIYEPVKQLGGFA